MNENALLDLKGVSKFFPGVCALDGVQFNLKKGEVHALMGENGAGKSTLIKMISGLYDFSCGEMIFEGKKVVFKSPHEAIVAGVSVIYQELNLIPNMSIAENIYFSHLPANKIGKVNKKKVFEDTQKLLDYIGLKESPKTILNALPVAKQQLVEIAKAISVNSKILIMDEPTSALSPTEIKNLFRIINDLKSKGYGIIYISHKLDEIFELSDRITVFRDGKYVDTVLTKETKEDQLIRMMVGRELSDLYPKEGAELGKTMLEVKGVTTNKVKDITFSVRAGEIVGFSGLMGAGRTELANAIIGADKRISGEIFVDGKKLAKNTTDASQKAGVGYVPENRKEQGIFAEANIRFNMTISTIKSFAKLFTINKGKEVEKVNELVKSLGIKTPSISQFIQKLSGGNQQKVIVARSLIKENLKVLVIDEPTRGIDIGAKAEIYTILDKLAQHGVAVVIMSSEMPEILSMCDRIFIMKHGVLTAELSREEATQELLLSKAI